MPNTLLGQLHLVAALVSIVLGATVLLLKGKGNRRHRQLGIAYAVSMIASNVTALTLFNMLGGIGPFHVLAVFSLTGIVIGWRAIYQARAARAAGQMLRRSHYIEVHYHWITFSYAGLLAAGASQVVTRLPMFAFARGNGLAFGLAVAVASTVVISIASRLIKSRRRIALAPFRVDAS